MMPKFMDNLLLNMIPARGLEARLAGLGAAPTPFRGLADWWRAQGVGTPEQAVEVLVRLAQGASGSGKPSVHLGPLST